MMKLKPNSGQTYKSVKLHMIVQILHHDKDHQMLFVGGPNTRTINQSWRMAAMKIFISPESIIR